MLVADGLILPAELATSTTGGAADSIGQTVVYNGMVEVSVLAGQSVTVSGQSVIVTQVVVYTMDVVWL